MAKIIRRCLKNMWVLACLAILIGPGPQLIAREGGSEHKMVRDVVQNPYKNYPEEFTGRGVLEALNSKIVVISDSEYSLDSNVSFHLPGRDHASPSAFEKGQAVAFIVNEEGQIISIWTLNQMEDLMPK
ncbi:MAG: hypothetical protein FP816_16020 [Desulfobacteraceae bacterium]|nr:hypothetical protein [Desulfobacteraceae bacterium]MBU4001480.1 hypothetical protein [Pseudomonadota bacterium]MBU4054045.1 hypothetical protein [Pseudomonadota bacterium]